MNLKNNTFAVTDDLNVDFDDFQPLDPCYPKHSTVQESYVQAEKDAQAYFWYLLYKKFCDQTIGFSDIELEYVSYTDDPVRQGKGIDRIIKFTDGRLPLHMEEKYVKGDSDKMFVEVYDNSDIRNNSRGWFYTLDPLNTNYIVYGYKWTKKFYFIPLKAFQEVFTPIFQGHHLYYVDDKVRVTGNRTKGILVPWNDIESKINGFVYIQL